MIDDSGYSGEYSGPEAPEQKIEYPISMSEIGQSVTEGQRFGSLIQTSQQAIKFGTSKVELGLGQGGGHEPVGAENYGDDARQALRELSKANQIEFVSTHSPTNIGNVSGFNQQQGNFSEQQRQESLEEVRKAIRFAGDVAQGGAVVVHTGEYWRDMSEERWNEEPISVNEQWDQLTPRQKKRAREGDFKEFLTYPSEQEEATHYLVDRRTGKLIQDVKKNVSVYEPVYRTTVDKNGNTCYADKDGNPIRDYEVFEEGVPEYDSTYGGVKVDPESPFTWQHFHNMAKQYEEDTGEKTTAAEMYMRSRLSSQRKQSKGMAEHYGHQYKQLMEARDKVKDKMEHFQEMDEDQLSDEEKVSRLTALQHELGIGGQMFEQEDLNRAIKEGKKPSEFIKDTVMENLDKKRSEFEALGSSYKTSEAEVQDNLDNIESVDKYAFNKSINSYAELGISAMEESKRPDVQKPIFVAPENIFPEMGYGSHPDEMIEMIDSARNRMIKMLTHETIEDPTGAVQSNGKTKEITNPYYRGISKEQAKKEAQEHIKMTFDTQHLGMWWKHFQPLPGETYDQRKERFNKWYQKMVDKLQEKDMIGHIHLVDSKGSGHHHLPAGQGDLPLYEAIETLKSKGFNGTLISEAWGEEGNFGQGRIVTEPWKHFGSPISPYGSAAPSPAFGSVKDAYFSQVQSPYFIFGGYVPSNEWKLWSEVPFE